MKKQTRKEYRNKLNRRLWALANKLGLDYEALHDALQIKSISALGIPDLRRACKILDDELHQRNRGQMSYKQRQKIKDLETELDWQEDPRRLAGFCLRITGFTNWENLPTNQASKLIVGLRRLKEYQERKSGRI